MASVPDNVEAVMRQACAGLGSVWSIMGYQIHGSGLDHEMDSERIDSRAAARHPEEGNSFRPKIEPQTRGVVSPFVALIDMLVVTQLKM